MLQNKRSGSEIIVRTRGFLVAVEVEDGLYDMGPSKVKDAIADALTWMEGVGKVEIDDLGSWDENEPNDQWENEGGAVEDPLHPKRRWND